MRIRYELNRNRIGEREGGREEGGREAVEEGIA